MVLWVANSKNERTKFWFPNRSRVLYWNEILCNSELFEENVGMLNFVILDIDLAFNSYWLLFMIMRLLSTYSVLCYCVFWKKPLLLACFVVIKYAAIIWILLFQSLTQVGGYKYLPCSSCRPNEEDSSNLFIKNGKELFIWND